MKKLFLFITLVIGFTGCKVSCEKAMRKYSHCFNEAKRDTVILFETPEIKSEGDRELRADTNFIDSVVYSFKDSCISRDSLKKTLHSTFKGMVATDSLVVDNDTFSLSVVYEKGKLSYSLTINPQVYEKNVEVPIYVPVENKPFLYDFLVGLGVLIIILFVIYLLFKKIK